MSKKKTKPVKKAPAKKVAKKSAPKSRAIRRLTGAASGGRTLHMTIVLFRTGDGNRIRTTPQRLYANPGDFVEWTVVNLIDGTDAPVTLSWPEGGPWGKEPIQIRSWERRPFGETFAGRSKFVVSAYDAQEDPEVEMPDGN